MKNAECQIPTANVPVKTLLPCYAPRWRRWKRSPSLWSMKPWSKYLKYCRMRSSEKCPFHSIKKLWRRRRSFVCYGLLLAKGREIKDEKRMSKYKQSFYLQHVVCHFRPCKSSPAELPMATNQTSPLTAEQPVDPSPVAGDWTSTIRGPGEDHGSPNDFDRGDLRALPD